MLHGKRLDRRNSDRVSALFGLVCGRICSILSLMRWSAITTDTVYSKKTVEVLALQPFFVK